MSTERTAARITRVALLVAALLAGRASADAHPVITVAIDPGHGGSNLGAPATVAGVYEKKVTLALSRLLRKRLERDGVTVVATRDSDTYLTLAERVRRANAANADVFVSLHANATPDHRRRGFDTFVLSREVNDIQAREAAVHGRDGVDGMIARARVRQVARDSARLAGVIRSHLAEVRGDDRGTRQAPYDVLEGLNMPATLVEIGFIDHPEEGRELLEADTLHAIADAIADGVEAFSAHGESGR